MKVPFFESAAMGILREVLGADFRRAWALVLSLGVLGLTGASVLAEENWPHWRGVMRDGAARHSQPPIEWSVNANISWKKKIEGKGHSSPIVWKNQVFLTTAIPSQAIDEPFYSGRPGAHDNLPVSNHHQFQLLCLDRENGEILWQKKLHECLPHEGGHQSASLASATPATDGKHVVAFLGSYGLFCLDMSGKLLWEKQLGAMHSKHGHGEGCSPVLCDGTIVINWDHEDDSFVVAFDAESGEQKWRARRPEVTSWSTPTVWGLGGKMQVVVCGSNFVRGYDLGTGEEIWKFSGMSGNIVSTPIVSDGVLYVGSSYEKRILMAVDLKNASGDITGTDRILWSRTRRTPYVPSVLLSGKHLYFLAHYQNVLTRVDSMTGAEAPGPMRLGRLGNIYSSPVAAGGHVYITDLMGTTMVITDTEVPRVVAVNSVDEPVSASVAIAGDELFIRGNEHLFRIAVDAPK